MWQLVTQRHSFFILARRVHICFVFPKYIPQSKNMLILSHEMRLLFDYSSNYVGLILVVIMASIS